MVSPTAGGGGRPGNGAVEEAWSALTSNTLRDLRSRRTERAWLYVRRRAKVKRRIEKAIAQRLMPSHKEAEWEQDGADVQMTGWKARFVEVSIEPGSWDRSYITIFKHPNAAPKQHISLSKLREVSKKSLPPAEALHFPVPQQVVHHQLAQTDSEASTALIQTATGDGNGYASEGSSDSDSEQPGHYRASADGEYRYGHLVYALEGHPHSRKGPNRNRGPPFYTELCCGSTRERDAWVQLLQDSMVLLEMQSVQAGAAVPLCPVPRPEPKMAAALELSYSDHWNKGRGHGGGGEDTGSASSDGMAGAGGNHQKKAPKGELIIQYKGEDRGKVRRLQECERAGGVYLSNTILRGKVTIKPRVVWLSDYLISSALHKPNSFSLIRVDTLRKSPEQQVTINFDLHQKDENRSERDRWLEYLLYIKALKESTDALEAGRWIRITDHSTSQQCFIEASPSRPGHSLALPAAGAEGGESVDGGPDGKDAAASSSLPLSASPSRRALLNPGGSGNGGNGAADAWPEQLRQPRVAFAKFPPKKPSGWRNELDTLYDRQIYYPAEAAKPAAVIDIPDDVYESWYGGRLPAGCPRPPRRRVPVFAVFDFNEVFQQEKKDTYIGFHLRKESDGSESEGEEADPHPYATELRVIDELRRRERVEYFDSAPRRPPCFPAPWELFDEATLDCTEVRTLGDADGPAVEFKEYVLGGGSISSWFTHPLHPDESRFRRNGTGGGISSGGGGGRSAAGSTTSPYLSYSRHSQSSQALSLLPRTTPAESLLSPSAGGGGGGGGSTDPLAAITPISPLPPGSFRYQGYNAARVSPRGGASFGESSQCLPDSEDTSSYSDAVTVTQLTVAPGFDSPASPTDAPAMTTTRLRPPRSSSLCVSFGDVSRTSHELDATQPALPTHRAAAQQKQKQKQQQQQQQQPSDLLRSIKTIAAATAAAATAEEAAKREEEEEERAASPQPPAPVKPPLLASQQQQRHASPQPSPSPSPQVSASVSPSPSPRGSLLGGPSPAASPSRASLSPSPSPGGGGGGSADERKRRVESQMREEKLRFLGGSSVGGGATLLDAIRGQAHSDAAAGDQQQQKQPPTTTTTGDGGGGGAGLLGTASASPSPPPPAAEKPALGSPGYSVFSPLSPDTQGSPPGTPQSLVSASTTNTHTSTLALPAAYHAPSAHRKRKGGGGEKASPSAPTPAPTRLSAACDDSASDSPPSPSKRSYKRCWCAVQNQETVDAFGGRVKTIVLQVSRVDAKNKKTVEVVPICEVRSIARIVKRARPAAAGSPQQPPPSDTFGFRVVASQRREFEFYANTEADRETWIATLKSVMKKERARAEATATTTSAAGLSSSSPSPPPPPQQQPQLVVPTAPAAHTNQPTLSSPPPKAASPTFNSLLGAQHDGRHGQAAEVVRRAREVLSSRPLTLEESRALLMGSFEPQRTSQTQSQSPPASAFPLPTPLSPVKQSPIPRVGSPSFKYMKPNF